MQTLWATGPAGSGACTFDNNGDLYCTGNTVKVAPTSDKRQVQLYGVASPENWFEDFGSGQLAGGGAQIALDPAFASTIDGGATYRVFLTPSGDCKGLYVTGKTAGGFEVRELGGGTSSVSFDYRIVAKRLGDKSVRLEDVTAQMAHMEQVKAEIAAKTAAQPSAHTSPADLKPAQ